MKKALFLDRDGVINKEKNYLYKKNDFEFIDGIFELCKYFQKRNYYIIVVTNQSGIARGYYSDKEFLDLSQWMEKKFLENNVIIDKIYYCPHHPDFSQNCNCRKPKPGMILQAQEELNIDLKHSIMVGDKERDIEAAINAGISETYLFNEERTFTNSKATRIVSKLEDIWKTRC